MDVTFNLDDPEVVSVANAGLVFWERFNGGLVALREQCCDAEQFHEFNITSANLVPPCCNVIFELTHVPVGVIVITIKCERSSVYFFASRRGRGDPGPNNNHNITSWRQCMDYNLIDGAVTTSFPAKYAEGENLGIGNLGIEGLRNAVIGLWFGQNEERYLKTLSVHVAEPVRYQWIADRFQEVIELNLYGLVDFSDMMKEFIKNWKVVSKAIQRHFIFDTPFQIPKPKLQHFTLDDTREIMGLIKRCGELLDEEN